MCSRSCFFLVFIQYFLGQTSGENVHYVTVGYDTFLKCEYKVDDFPKDHLRFWMLEQNGKMRKITQNNQVLLDSKHFQLFKDEDFGIYNLNVLNADVKETNGSYSCVILDPLDPREDIEVEANYVLIVRIQPPLPNITPKYPTVHEGTGVEFKCTFMSMNSTPTISWTDENLKDLSLYDETFTTRDEVDWNLDEPGNSLVTSTLRFKAERRHNNMKLLCRVWSESTKEFGHLEDGTVLNVVFRAVIKIFPQGNFSIEKGSNLKITCDIHANPKPILFYWSWRNIYHGQKKAVELVNATEKDSGTYSCHSGNILGRGVAQNTTVDVLFGPIHSHPSVVEVKEGSNFRFSCEVKARPQAETWWRKYEDPTFRVNGTELEFTPVKKQHASLYYCESRNILRLSTLVSASLKLEEKVTRTNFSLIVLDKCARGNTSNHMEGENSSDCDEMSFLPRNGTLLIIFILGICLPVPIVHVWLSKIKTRTKNTLNESSGTDERNSNPAEANTDISAQSRLRSYRYRLARQFRPPKLEPAVV